MISLGVSGMKETSFNTPNIRYAPSEMDRSIGSSATFVANSPAYEMFGENNQVPPSSSNFNRKRTGRESALSHKTTV